MQGPNKLFFFLRKLLLWLLLLYKKTPLSFNIEYYLIEIYLKLWKKYTKEITIELTLWMHQFFEEPTTTFS